MSPPVLVGYFLLVSFWTGFMLLCLAVDYFGDRLKETIYNCLTCAHRSTLPTSELSAFSGITGLWRFIGSFSHSVRFSDLRGEQQQIMASSACPCQESAIHPATRQTHICRDLCLEEERPEAKIPGGEKAFRHIRDQQVKLLQERCQH